MTKEQIDIEIAKREKQIKLLQSINDNKGIARLQNEISNLKSRGVITNVGSNYSAPPNIDEVVTDATKKRYIYIGAAALIVIGIFIYFKYIKK